MFQQSVHTTTKTTTHQVVIPFYLYAAFSLLVATFLLLFTGDTVADHYFLPGNLAITHIMALGWGTMMIIGASHQLIPVLIEAPLFNNFLAYTSFVLAAAGIPLLSYGFYVFYLGLSTQIGGILICISILVFLINMALSMMRSKNENIHAFFIFTAVLWLASTATVGLLLLYNFTHFLLPQNSLAYLPLHAHLGIVGWFLLLVIGVGSRLIPMFMISKYTNNKLLWWIYGFVNAGLLFYIIGFFYFNTTWVSLLSISLIGIAVLLFVYFCFKTYQTRIRKSIDAQVRISLAAICMMLIPLLCLLCVLFLLANGNDQTRLIIDYGFVIFFGWLTSIILGMTFKTLPFIIWNKVYLKHAGKGKSPNPKDLFSEQVFRWMCICYLPGFLLFAGGIWVNAAWALRSGAVLLLIAALLYNFNVLKLILHKSKVHHASHH